MDTGNRKTKRKLLGFIGAGGAIFAALCCIGTPALLAFLASVGLGFIINDAILIPALIGFLALTGYGLTASKDRHGRKGSR